MCFNVTVPDDEDAYCCEFLGQSMNMIGIHTLGPINMLFIISKCFFIRAFLLLPTIEELKVHVEPKGLEIFLFHEQNWVLKLWGQNDLILRFNDV